MRGGEKVLESLCRLFPDADLLTLVHVRGSVSPADRARAESGRRSSSDCPRPARFYRHYLPLFPDGDRVLRSRRRGPGGLDEPLRGQGGGADRPRGAHLLLPFADAVCLGSVRRLLRARARRAASATRVAAAGPGLAGAVGSRHRAAGSTASSPTRSYVAGRIARYYNRRASVLHPPVDTQFFTPGDAPPASVFPRGVGAGARTSASTSRFDAASRLGVPLKIVGTGPDLRRACARSAGADVEFLGQRRRRRAARRLPAARRRSCCPAEEDFGIVAGRSHGLRPAGRRARPRRRHGDRRSTASRACSSTRRRRTPLPTAMAEADAALRSIRRPFARTPNASASSGSRPAFQRILADDARREPRAC